ncbi:MAG: hypothetical protein ACRDYF_10585 [Acidimicrobiia bacterium]
MTGRIRLLATLVGVLFIVFAVVVAVYAGEPFNIATFFGVGGVALIAKLHWSRLTET